MGNRQQNESTQGRGTNGEVGREGTTRRGTAVPTYSIRIRHIRQSSNSQCEVLLLPLLHSAAQRSACGQDGQVGCWLH